MKYTRKLTLGPATKRIEEADLDVLDVTNETLVLYHTHVDKLIIHNWCDIHLRCGSGIDSIEWINTNGKGTVAKITTHSEGCEIPYKHLPKGLTVEHVQDE